MMRRLNLSALGIKILRLSENIKDNYLLYKSTVSNRSHRVWKAAQTGLEESVSGTLIRWENPDVKCLLWWNYEPSG